MNLKIDFMPKFYYKNPKNVQNIGHNPVSDYLLAVDFYRNRLWRLIGGKFYVKFRFQWVSAVKFEAKYKPVIPVKFNYSKENADKTKNYLQ
jgi:hypothetical protein